MKSINKISLLLITLMLSFGSLYIPAIASAVPNESTSTSAGADIIKSSIKGALENIDEKYDISNNEVEIANETKGFFATLWEKIKAFFKSLFSFLVKDSKEELINNLQDETKSQKDDIHSGILDDVTDDLKTKAETKVKDYLTNVDFLTEATGTKNNSSNENGNVTSQNVLDYLLSSSLNNSKNANDDKEEKENNDKNTYDKDKDIEKISTINVQDISDLISNGLDMIK